MTSRTFIKELKTESLIRGKGYLFEVAQGIYEDKNKRSFILKNRVDIIKNKVSEITGVSIEAMESGVRQKNIIKAKHIVMSECIRLHYGSLRMIAKEFYLGNHTSVISACKSVSNQYDTNKEYRALIDKIRSRNEAI